ncbi:PIN domain-containing protein [Candidatus Woesearchaeota archaeon]|nr:PIN domain-containing protein [Candidatus Woesearchaeota archaeon]
MNIVVDANIVISALIGSRATLTIITAQHYKFYSPKKILDEIRKHKDDICKFINQDSEEFDINFNALSLFINVVDYKNYALYMNKAVEAIEKRDLNDADYIACALAVNADFIWTNDRDFIDQALIPTKTTDQFIEENK